jgi:CHAT domain-containing protein
MILRLIGLVALVLTSAMTGASAAPAAKMAALQLGQNLAGEACSADGAPSPLRPVNIVCGMTTTASGRMQVSALTAGLPADAMARRSAVLVRAKTIVAGLSVSEQISCDGGQFLTASGGSDSVLFLCTVQANSWPRIVIVSGHDRTAYQAEGIPSLFPVLQAGIARASARQVDAAETGAGQRLLEARLPPAVLKSSAADFGSYGQFIELARLYGGANNYAGAEAAYRSTLDIETRLFGPDSGVVGVGLAELALQVSNQGRFAEAAGLFQRAAPIIEASPSNNARARLNSYLALDAANRRDYVNALSFARAATIARRAEVDAVNGIGTTVTGQPAASSGELAHSLRIEAEMALRLDDVAAARAAAEEALWIVGLEPGLPLWWRADALELMGQVNERQGRVTAAERNYLDAAGIDQKLFGDAAPTALMELRVGRFYTNQQLYPAALPHFRAAMAILAKDPVTRAAIVPDQIVPFIAAASAVSADPQQRAVLDGEIFHAAQLVSSDVADQTITRASVRVAAGNPMLAELVRQAQEASRTRDNARIDLAAEFAKPDDERNAQREAQLANNLRDVSLRADQLLANLQQRFPDYARLANPAPAELGDVRARLRDDEAFVSFVIGVRGSYALLVTTKGLAVRQLIVSTECLPTTDCIGSDIADLRRSFVPVGGVLPQFSLVNANTLYNNLLRPFEEQLMGVTHLIVAPGPDLENLPFSLLVTAPPAGGGAATDAAYVNAAWLVRRMSVSQVPSPRAFLSLRLAQENRIAAPMPFLGLGDPLFDGPATSPALDTLAQGCREAGPMPAAQLRALPPLHDTADEVNAVARVLGGGAGTVLLGANASETSFRGRPLDQYRVLYFATHGLLPGELHCQAEPGLVLSPPATSATTTDADGLLDASEIAALKLNADLVVLSACNTAAAGGGRFGGGALEGLADAFFNAGARAVLASYWEVPTVATTRLMTGLFQRYGQDRTRGVAEALRQSQLALIATPASAHPFNWAAFTLIGDDARAAMAASAAAPKVRQAKNGGQP